MVVQEEALTAIGHPRVGQPLVAEVRLIDLGFRRVGDHGTVRDTIDGTVIGLATELCNVLSLEEPREAADLAGAVTQAGSQRGSTGVFVETVLVNEFIAVARIQRDLPVTQRVSDRVRRERRRCQQCQGQPYGGHGAETTPGGWCISAQHTKSLDLRMGAEPEPVRSGRPVGGYWATSAYHRL